MKHMQESLLKLIELKSVLIERIKGNVANQENEKKIVQPYIDKIDEQIDKLLTSN